MDIIQTYKDALADLCRQVDRVLFAQSSFLLRNRVTLEDIYVPLSLTQVASCGLVQCPPYYLLTAPPGSGKSTFCKRLALAMLEKDAGFFRQYTGAGQPNFPTDGLPVLISCREIGHQPLPALRDTPFPQLLSRLVTPRLCSWLPEADPEQFAQLFAESPKLFLILDSWEELRDSMRARLFRQSLDPFLQGHPQTGLLTIRKTYPAPLLFWPYYESYELCPLSDENIADYCARSVQLLRKEDPQQAALYERFPVLLQQSRDPAVKQMMRNPLELSILLAVSRSDGALPKNRAELFRALVEHSIDWTHREITCRLSEKTTRMFLSYIALYFTKNGLLECNNTQLFDCIRQATLDLSQDFSQDIFVLPIGSIFSELLHIGLLGHTGPGTYSFATEGHLQLQEYLSAYAILSGYTDAEFQQLSPTEILENRYTEPQWYEPVLFLALLGTPRLRRAMIRQLLDKAETSGDGVYCSLLSAMISNGVPMDPVTRHRIEAVCRNSTPGTKL